MICNNSQVQLSAIVSWYSTVCDNITVFNDSQVQLSAIAETELRQSELKCGDVALPIVDSKTTNADVVEDGNPPVSLEQVIYVLSNYYFLFLVLLAVVY